MWASTLMRLINDYLFASVDHPLRMFFRFYNVLWRKSHLSRIADRKRDRLGKSCCFTIVARCHEEVSLKLLRKVRLIKKVVFAC